MSNRILWVLIIFAFMVVWFFYWTFVYVPNKVAKDKEQVINTEIEKKAVKLTKIEDVVKVEEKTLTPEEKIAAIKNNNAYYKTINVWNDVFTFLKKDNNLTLELNKNLVWNFDLVPDTKLEIQKVYSSDTDFYLVVWNKKYIYNSLADLLFELDLSIDVNYIKRSDDLYIINTSKGSFVYNKANKNLEYFTFFEDFIYYKDSYIWIVKKDDEIRIKNLSLGSIDWDSIYLYNPTSKEKKSLYVTSLELQKIYTESGEVYFETSNWEKYKLENLE